MNRLIEVQRIRGPFVESRHNAVALIIDHKANVVKNWGPLDYLTYPRSSVKLLQAIAFVESGAIEKFNLSKKCITLACASHGGETAHTDTVQEWLNKLQFTESHLACGVHPPTNKESEINLIKNKKYPNQLHNNCSGKHTGFLSLAKQLGVLEKNYIDYDHPVQIKVREVLESLSGLKLSKDKMAIDGCSIPTYIMPLIKLASSFLPFIDQNYSHSDAAKQILNAISDEPYFLAGTNRLDSDLIRVTQANCIFKIGAEGVYAGLIKSHGHIVVLKVLDGSSDAAQICLLHLLLNQGYISEEQFHELSLYSQIKEYNHKHIHTSQNKTIL